MHCFSGYMSFFKTMKKEIGEEKALDIFREVMETGLAPAFGSDSKKGTFEAFKNIAGAVDEAVGLKVEFVRINDNEFYFRLLNDIFPNLKGIITQDQLNNIYMPFKVSHMLGNAWDYKCTKHLWNNDAYTEYHIFKK